MPRKVNKITQQKAFLSKRMNYYSESANMSIECKVVMA